MFGGGLRQASLANPDHVDGFLQSSARMGEGFKSNVHFEGNCVDGGKPAIDDHDVTLVHRKREDETFQRIATKDQIEPCAL